MRKLIFALFIIVFMGCREENQSTDSPGIHIRLHEDPERLLPAIHPTPTSREVNQYIFIPLADFDPQSLLLSPILITRIPDPVDIEDGPYKGGVRFDIELRQEAVWSDGSPITGHDYLFTLKAIKTPQVNAGRYRSFLDYIKDVQVDSSNHKKFSVLFSEDYMLALETALTIEIYPKHIYDPEEALSGIGLEELNDFELVQKTIEKDSAILNFANNFNGMKYSREVVDNCGPYMLESWESNQTVVLRKKENYWGEALNIPALKAGPEKIIFHIIPDETSALNQLKEGNIDVMTNISATNFTELRSSELYRSRLQFFTPQLTKYYYLLLNNADKILSDKDVRRALAHLVDVDNIINSLEDGLGARTIGPFLPKKPYYESSLEPIPYDPQKALAILNEDGWKDTNGNGILDKSVDGNLREIELDMYVSSAGVLGKSISLMLQEEAQKLGIKINIIQKEWRSIRNEHIRTRDYDMSPVVAQQDLVIDDPYNKWHSINNNSLGANEAAFEHPVIDSLIMAIRSTRNEAERNDLYRRFQKIVYEEQPVIFLYSPVEKIAVNARWKAGATEKRPGYMANTFEYVGAEVASEN